MTVRSSFGPSARPGFPKGLQVGGRAGRRGRALIAKRGCGGGRGARNAAPPKKIFACFANRPPSTPPQVLLVTPNEADLKARLTSFEYEGA